MHEIDASVIAQLIYAKKIVIILYIFVPLYRLLSGLRSKVYKIMTIVLLVNRFLNFFN